MISIILFVVLIVIYHYCTRNYDYWANRNIKHDKPVPIFGNALQNLLGKKNIVGYATEMYKKYPGEKVVGFYRGAIPELIIRDPEMIRRILIVDFNHFNARGIGRDYKAEPILGNIGHADGDLWKLLRQRLTPAFTTAKVKAMFPLVVKCAESFQKLGEDVVAQGGECNVHELMTRFTIDVIGACGFGIEMDTINNEKSLFRDLGIIMFRPTWRNNILVALWDLFPEMRNVFQWLFAEHEIMEAVTEIFENIRKQRNFKPIGRNDFIDLLLELEAQGNMVGESIEKQGPRGEPVQIEKEMDAACMAAQIAFFFGAGFETSASASSYLLYELAFNPEEQQMIQNDIDRALAKYDNKICYDSIADMSLLYLGFKEAMRILPPVGTLWRTCVKKYTFSELGVTIDPGVKILIPIQSIQNDEKYFKNADKFDINRFANSIEHKYTYLPFGAGPRACTGTRLGELQSLVGVAAILQKFSVVPTSSLRYRELKLDQTSNLVQSVLGGYPLKLVPRNKKI